jgi:hypothetical protein
MWKTQWRNRWCDHNGTEWVKDTVWDKTFPKYDIIDKLEAIGTYWDDYRKRMMHMKEKFPANVQLLRMEELNNLQGQQKIFDFLEIPEKKRRYMDIIKYNARESKHESWKKVKAFRWFQKLNLTSKDITSVIPTGINFILVDQEQIRDYIPEQYPTIPYLERDGVYWGPPSDDTTAIRELNRLQQSGAQFIVFTWPAFWWFNHYTGFHTHLRSNYPCFIENDRVVGFDLRKKI